MDIARATLAIILTEDEKEIWLGWKRKGSKIGEYTLNGPGGDQELGETIWECAERETKEEFGITLDKTKTKKVAIITFHYYANGVPVPYMEMHVFRTSFFIGEPHATKSMIPEKHDADDLPFGNMLESDSRWFVRAAKGEKFCANAYYREKKAKGFINIEFLPFFDSE